MNSLIFMITLVIIIFVRKSDTVKLQNQQTALFLDTNENGDVFTQRTIHFGRYKDWDIITYKDGWSFIQSQESGLFLTAISRIIYVYADVFKNNTNQQWKLIGKHIYHRATGKVLDSNFYRRVYISVYNGGNYQRWGQLNLK